MNNYARVVVYIIIIIYNYYMWLCYKLPLIIAIRPNKVKNMFLILLPGHFCQAVKHFLLTIQIILWIALRNK